MDLPLPSGCEASTWVMEMSSPDPPVSPPACHVHSIGFRVLVNPKPSWLIPFAASVKGHLKGVILVMAFWIRHLPKFPTVL